MPDIFNPYTYEAIRNELQAICDKYNVTEMIVILEVNKKQTALLQQSKTDCSNIGFNNLFESLQQIFQEEAEQNNAAFKNLGDGK